MSKKKTHEEYVEELYNKNPTVEAVDLYVDARTPILHHCLLHDVFWNTAPYRVLQGCGCPKCKKEKFHKSRCRTHDQYVLEVKVVNPNVEILEQYIDARTPILHRCKIDGYIWKPIPDSILHGHGCPKCRDRWLHEQKAKTQKQYEEEVSKLHPTIKVLGIYINSETPILHQCLIDGHIWLAKPANILHGKGCPKCVGNIKLTHGEYIKRLSVINPYVVPIEEYININTPILHKCLIDGNIWKVVPHSLLQGYGCPKCARNMKKTHEEYKQELFMKNPDIEVMENYMGMNKSILHRCKIDGYIWPARPSNILYGSTGCPCCRKSHGEKEIYKWLEFHGVEYKYQYSFADCRDKKALLFDFYLPQLNVCIEYDGIQHFQPIDFAGKGEKWAIQNFEGTQLHDKIKDKYCRNNNISLLRIPYYKNIEEELEKFLFT